MTNSDLRKKARESLAGKWKSAVLLTLVYVLISIIATYIEKKFENQGILNAIITTLISLFNMTVAYGLIISFMKLKREQGITSYEFLNNFGDNFKRSLFVTIRMALKMIVPIILIIISSILIGSAVVFSATSILSGSSSSSPSALAIIGIILLIVSTIYAIIKGLSFSLSFYIAYDNPEMSALDVVNKSAELMVGHKGQFFLLDLSFIGWAILAAFTLGIGFLWLIPYMQVSQICFYEQYDNINNVEVKTEPDPEKTEE